MNTELKRMRPEFRAYPKKLKKKSKKTVDKIHYMYYNIFIS